MKKFASSFLVGLLLLGLAGSVSSAEAVEDSGSTVPKGYKIVKVYDSSSNNLSRQDLNNLGLSQMIVTPSIISSNPDEDVTIDTLKNETKPVYDLENIKTGEIVTQYETNLAVKASGTFSDNGHDPNYNVVGYGTIYFIYSGPSSVYAALDKVDWRYELSDNSVSLSKITHNFQQSGASLNTGTAVNQRKTLNPVTLSGTDLVRNWGWDPVDTIAGLWKFGVEMNATVNRNGSTWAVQVLVFRASGI